jgi:pimeloyl-ACP methyl ester carboxylesterase
VQLPDPEAFIRAPGPWSHRDVSANGSRFHVVDAGEGPAVVLLHGFPTFWWTWRHQVTALADAGYRVLAMDLRGYGGSDHPPEGYDPRTLSADVAGVIRSVGEENAVIVGHGWGGLVAWSAAILEPETVRAIVPVSMPHPRLLRRALLRRGKQRSAMRYTWSFQLPFVPESRLARHDGQRVIDLMTKWSHNTAWLDETTAGAYRAAFMRWPTPHTAVEYHRWGARSSIRPDGLTYMALMEAPIQQRVLQVQGALDPMILPSSVDGSEEYVRGGYERADLESGHFPHEEIPDRFTTVLLNWLKTL